MIDLKEFIKISEDIVDEIEKHHDKKLQDMIAEARSEASQKEAAALKESRLANPSEAPIPWGWTHFAPDVFQDIVSGYETRKLPEIDQYSFSCMAYSSAPRCLNRIHRFVDDYRLLTIVDNSTRDITISDADDTIKKAVLKFANLENQTEPEAWFSDLDHMVSECRKISEILEDKQPRVRFKITSAQGLPKATWATFTYPPNPFAVLYEGESKKSETGVAIKTVDPDWQHPWASFKLCSAESKGPSTLPKISVFDGVWEEKRIDAKYLIGKTDCISVDGYCAACGNPRKALELSFKGHSLFEPFSGDVQLDLGYASQGTITARVEWAGLSNLIRKEKLQLKEFLEANPDYRPPFPEEVEQSAALAAVRVMSDDRHPEQGPSLAFLTLPNDWRFRGVPEAHYSGSEGLRTMMRWG